MIGLLDSNDFRATATTPGHGGGLSTSSLYPQKPKFKTGSAETSEIKLRNASSIVILGPASCRPTARNIAARLSLSQRLRTHRRKGFVLGCILLDFKTRRFIFWVGGGGGLGGHGRSGTLSTFRMVGGLRPHFSMGSPAKRGGATKTPKAPWHHQHHHLHGINADASSCSFSIAPPLSHCSHTTFSVRSCNRHKKFKTLGTALSAWMQHQQCQR